LVFLAIFTAVYLYLPDFFIFFLIGFILGVLTLIYHCSLIFFKPTTLPHQKLFIVLSVVFYVGGFLFFWVPEILFCDNLKSFNFHSLWHVTSTLGCFVMVLFCVFQREAHRGKKPELNYNCILGIPMIPYIHIPMNEKSNINTQENFEVKKSKKKRSSVSTLR